MLRWLGIGLAGVALLGFGHTPTFCTVQYPLGAHR